MALLMKSQCQPGHQAARVPLAQREDVGADREQLEQDQREEEVRHRLEEHEPGQDPVEPAPVPPAGHDAQRGAHEEGDERRRAHQVIVQGIVWTSRLDTLAGYWDTSVPKLKCETSTRYAQYWCQMEPGWPTPSMASSAR